VGKGDGPKRDPQEKTAYFKTDCERKVVRRKGVRALSRKQKLDEGLPDGEKRPAAVGNRTGNLKKGPQTQGKGGE